MRNLQSFVHVSTAYCHCDRKVINEQFYPVSQDPEALIKLLELPEVRRQLDEPGTTREYLGERPNSYTLTKALAEWLVYQQNGNLPLAIVRPSIVVAAASEPIKGWIDNLNGPTGEIEISLGRDLIFTN